MSTSQQQQQTQIQQQQSSSSTLGGMALPSLSGGANPSGIVPTLQNIVATVNLDCRLDLKTIALHARNAEYNPKVSLLLFSPFGVPFRGPFLSSKEYENYSTLPLGPSEICGRHHANQRAQDNCPHLCLGQNGRHWRKVRGNVQTGLEKVCPHHPEARLPGQIHRL